MRAESRSDESSRAAEHRQRRAGMSRPTPNVVYHLRDFRGAVRDGARPGPETGWSAPSRVVPRRRGPDAPGTSALRLSVRFDPRECVAELAGSSTPGSEPTCPADVRSARWAGGPGFNVRNMVDWTEQSSSACPYRGYSNFGRFVSVLSQTAPLGELWSTRRCQARRHRGRAVRYRT